MTALLLMAITYSEHIAPIVYSHCAGCHRPGEAAPFSLLSYEDARKHATQIAAVTSRRYMPPWPPAPGIGEFQGDRHLTDAQIALFAEWAKSGALEGDLAKAPPAPRFTEGWQLGEPDLILRMPVAFSLPAGGPDLFRNFVLPVNVPAARFVRAIELRPGNKGVVHHANVIVDRARSLRPRDGKDGRPGFDGMDVETESDREFAPDSHFLFWKPGAVPEPLPADMAWRLEPGSDLVVNLHLRPSGKPEAVQASIGLYFTDQAPKRFPMLLQLEHDGAIDIAPGAADAAVTDQLTLPVDVDLLAIYPHAHYLGKRVEAWAEPPSGSRVPLLQVDDWDINWQATYTYREPVRLPAGTRVAMRITYDNRASNPRNPSHPPKRVRTGNRSEDEMGHVWLQVLPVNGDFRLKLQEALMRRRIEKYPADYAAHFNLAAALQSAGREGEAIQALQRAIQIKPASAAARNSLAASLMTAGRLPEAIAQLREALRRDPSYVNARFNLAQALTATGNAEAAIAEYRSFLAARPDDVKAHVNLAGILVERRQFAQAAIHFRRAVSLQPDDADLATNLGTALALSGDVPAAIGAFERALALNPQHATARANLVRARGNSRTQGKALKAKGDAAGALAAFEQAAAEEPKAADLRDEIGFLLAVQGRRDEAIARFREALAINPNYAPAHYHLGVALWLKEDRDGAMAALQEAVRLDPTNAEYRLRLAESWNMTGLKLQERGEHELARDAYAKAVALKPADVEYRNNLGFMLVDTGAAQQGMQEFLRILKQDPTNRRAQVNIGYAYLQAGDYDAALAQFRKLAKQYPDEAVIRYDLALALKQKDQIEEAKKEFREALRLNPDMVEGYYTLGITVWQNGEFEAAAGAMREAVNRRPDYAAAHFMLGTALKQLGDLPKAAAALEEAIRLDPSTPGPFNTLAQIKQTQGDREVARKLFAQAAEVKQKLEAAQAKRLGTGPATKPIDRPRLP